MARKSNPESDKVVSGGAAARPRRTTTTARPKVSAAAAGKPVAPSQAAKTETQLAVSGMENGAEPSRDAIARLAYLYWLDRGGLDGSAEEDWLRAEQELRQQAAPIVQ